MMRIYYGAFLEPSPVDFTCTIHVISGKFYFSVSYYVHEKRAFYFSDCLLLSFFFFAYAILITFFSYLCIQIL